MYLDSAYIAKYYVNEPDSKAVRKAIQRATYVCSSAWALIEVTCVFHRHMREGSLSASDGLELIGLFHRHASEGVWGLIPATGSLMRRTSELVRDLAVSVPLRAGDAIHLATALDADEGEIWTNDRHLLSAAPHCGIVGRSV